MKGEIEMKTKKKMSVVKLGQDVSVHFGTPYESFIRIKREDKLIKDILPKAKEYQCAEDLKQDLQSIGAPLAPNSTYDETARLGFALIERCENVEALHDFLLTHLTHPSAILKELTVPRLSLSEIGRNLPESATEMSRACYAACCAMIAIAVSLACLVQRLDRAYPSQIGLPDYPKKDI
jgi:hypothetical protein